MTSFYQESNPLDDIMDHILGVNDSDKLSQEQNLGVIEFDDMPMTYPNGEQEQQHFLPEVTYYPFPNETIPIPSNHTTSTIEESFQDLLQNNSPESGFGDGSSVATQSPYQESSTPGLLSPASDYSSHSPRSSTSRSSASSIYGGISDEVAKPIAIHIPEGAKHKYRHAKEMKIGHGGLKGEITLPTDYKSQNYKIILSVLPACNSKQKVHPCMLHVTVMNQNSKQKRAKYRTKLESPKDWMVTLEIENGKVFYIPNYGPCERFQIDCLKDGQLILGGNNLQMTIISPLQGKKEAEGIKLVSVIRDRIQAEKIEIRETAEQIAESYTSAKANKIDLHKCRLRAQVYKQQISYDGYNMIWNCVGQDISPDIIDGRDQNVGSFDLEGMSEPNHCCTEGGWKVILISKYKTATVGKEGNRDMMPPVFPVFVFVDDDIISRPELLFPSFQQIDIGGNNLSIHGGAFIFNVPPQNYDVICQMRKQQKNLRLALYRSLDNTYSETSYEYKYTPHYDGCPFCIIRLGNEYMAYKIPTGNVKKRRRNTSFDMNPQLQQDYSQDTSPYNGVTQPQEPGLSTIDFNLEMASDSELQNALVQDCKPLKEKMAVGISCLENNFCLKNKMEPLVPDHCEVDVVEQKSSKENANEENDFEEESSVNENSEPEESFDEEIEENDYDNETNNEDYKKNQWESVNNERNVLKDESGTKLSLEVEIPVSGDASCETSTDKSLNEEDIKAKSDSRNSDQEPIASLQLDKQKISIQSDDNIEYNLSIAFMISILMSLIFGWAAGFFSLHHEFIFTFVMIFVVIGAFMGFYFDRQINNVATE